VLGRAERPISRAGARAGDEVWVSGTLGAGPAAIESWDAGSVPPDALRGRFARPAPRVELARALAAAEVPTAMLDLSDGLAGDASHLVAASGAGIIIEEAAVPVDSGARAVLGESAALSAALHGGEDFEICFTARPGTVEAWLAERGSSDPSSVPLTRVGRVVEGEGVRIESASGEIRTATRGGYDHWSEA
jgi:thiamine-monophosphate kinase